MNKLVSVSKLKVSKNSLILVACTCAVFALSHSILLASVAGVSAAKLAQILGAAYEAYKKGEAVEDAIALITGPGAVVTIIANFLLTWGIGYVLNSDWLKSM
ncbi:hypothetical protein [Clostridium sp. HBUAS56017]|uniref:hypothetical protein n=1 Tax=Clostridium sp. HBUAS56017 TaxID=2571128 RepID=UPI001177B66A|nr:hypothetical protein [Clostridium sp. HBUAS56017]